MVLGSIVAVIAAVSSFKQAHEASSSEITLSPQMSESDICEWEVSRALAAMGSKSYVIFNNVILPSRGNTAHTEVDHIVVSPYGIFCIETKSHHGSIYGYSDARRWVQYLGSTTNYFMNPVRQNYKHLCAIKDLLGAELKAPIHSYVVFPNARVVVDGEYVDYSIDEVVDKIKNHTTQYYNLNECERILKMIAYASSRSEELRPIHHQEVQAFVVENPI